MLRNQSKFVKPYPRYPPVLPASPCASPPMTKTASRFFYCSKSGGAAGPVYEYTVWQDVGIGHYARHVS